MMNRWKGKEFRIAKLYKPVSKRIIIVCLDVFLHNYARFFKPVPQILRFYQF